MESHWQSGFAKPWGRACIALVVAGFGLLAACGESGVSGGQGSQADVLVCVAVDASAAEFDAAVEESFAIGEVANTPVRSFLRRESDHAFSFEWGDASAESKRQFLDAIALVEGVTDVREEAATCTA